MLRRNIELKARIADLTHARRVAAELPARSVGTLHQTDTYFNTANGRLKLRETLGEPAHLIWYQRPDDEETRVSQYYLIPSPDPEGLKAALTASYGQRVVVQKGRELFLYRNVRIHLDEVTGLGAFLEFEAVLTPEQPDAEGHELLARLRERFQIADSDLIACSYSDLLLERTARSAIADHLGGGYFKTNTPKLDDFSNGPQ